jgi:heterodisulfide reductase subunit C
LENLVLSKLDKDFKYEIAARPGAAFFKRCFSCGTCTASCPVSDIDENFNPRLFIRQALLGMREQLLSSKELWYCTQCYTCYARCPQDVRFTDVMAILRDMAVEQGYAPKEMKDKAEKVDQLSQKLRHAISEYAYARSAKADAKGMPENILTELKQGLKELE